MLHGLGDQTASGLGIVKVAGHGMAGAAFFGQGLGLRASPAIAEHHVCARGGKHANGRCANAARAAGDQRDFTRERQGNGHS